MGLGGCPVIVTTVATLASSAPGGGPGGSCDARDYGAVGDGVAFDTAAVQAAIDDRHCDKVSQPIFRYIPVQPISRYIPVQPISR